MNYRTVFNTRVTPQAQPIPGAGQTANSAGGFAWQVDDWTQLERFLILGSEGGTFYVGEQKLTVDNAQAAVRCLQADGLRVVAQVVDVSQGGKAAKNDPALFVLALASGLGDLETRRAAMAALPAVARTGTHLFHFLEYVEGVRGWGRLLRNGVTDWYNGMDASRLAYQAVKYQQRDGWSHRDALRLAKPVPATPQHDAIFGWIAKGWSEVGGELPADESLRLLWVYEQAKRAASEEQIRGLVREHRLTWEFVPSEWLGSPSVWEELLPNLPLGALLRNLGRLSANGLLVAGAAEVDTVAARLRDRDAIRRARLHPLAVLVAMKTYASGQGVRGSLKWEPVSAISDALDEAFYLAFENVEATGKRTMLALDVSGSMEGPDIAGMPGISPRIASAALALVTMRTEEKVVVTAFTSAGSDGMGSVSRRRHDSGISTLDLSPRQRLDDVVKRISGLPFGGTDCALPMLYALERGLEVDAFVVYTDSETWAGSIHPSQALAQYRERTGIPAKLVVVGMTSNGFSIADPRDPGMLDVVGMSTETPQVISQFIRG
ncbi:MAG: TROVE domain-containing protein [Caldilineaceae bacterium]|nr:TROVE domain-containing protein [Caldilineaceae bacterium]